MSAGSLAGALSARVVLPRLGTKRTFLLCHLALVTVLTLRVFAGEIETHIILASLAGLIFSIWAVCLSPLTASLVPQENRSRAFSLLFSVGIGLGAIGGIAGSRIPHSSQRLGAAGGIEGMRGTLLCGVAIAALGAIFSSRIPDFREETPHAERDRHIVPRGSARLFLAIAAWSFVTGSFSPFASIFFTRRLGMPLPDFGNLFFLCQAGQVLAVLAAPHLARRFKPEVFLLLSQLVVAGCLVSIALTGNPHVSAAAYVIQTAGQWMIEPVIYAALMDMTPPHDRSGASASLTLVIGCSQLFAAGLAGWGFSKLGYPPSLLAVSIIAVLTGIIFRFSALSRSATEKAPLDNVADVHFGYDEELSDG